MPPVEALLIAGGAVSSVTGFPGLRLDCPVIAADRPGTGRHVAGPTHLAEQAQWLADQVGDRGPVIVVAHSLGGAVAVQLALDHPSVVAGVVLLDPTTFTDPTLVKRTVSAVPAVAALMRAPLLGRAFGGFATRSHRHDPVLAQASAEMVAPAQWTALSTLLTHFPADAALLTSRLEASPLQVRGILATAERKETSAPFRTHRRMAQLTGLELQMWPGTTHTMHFERQERIAAAVTSLAESLEQV